VLPGLGLPAAALWLRSDQLLFSYSIRIQHDRDGVHHGSNANRGNDPFLAKAFAAKHLFVRVHASHHRSPELLLREVSLLPHRTGEIQCQVFGLRWHIFH